MNSVLLLQKYLQQRSRIMVVVLIIGSTSTYGKGTVQRNIGLDPETGFSMSNSELGTVKLTLQKFYRINGGSTQLKGVTSDIVLT